MQTRIVFKKYLLKIEEELRRFVREEFSRFSILDIEASSEINTEVVCRTIFRRGLLKLTTLIGPWAPIIETTNEFQIPSLTKRRAPRASHPQ